MQEIKGIVMDGTKTVGFEASQTTAGSHHSGEQARATTIAAGVGNGDI